MKRYIFILLIIFSCSLAKAQNLPKYNLYNQNVFLINPAAIGVNGGINAFIGHKSQWLGTSGAPQATYISVDGLMTKSMGFGLNLFQQTMGIFKMQNAGVSYAYRIAFSNFQAISFGVSASFVQNSLVTNNLDEEELLDPAMSSNKFERALFYNGFGIEYRFKNFIADLSIPLIYSAQEDKFLQNAYLYTAYNFYTTDKMWRVQPSVLFKYTQTSPFTADINILGEWNSSLWMQASYRTNNELYFGAGVFVKYIGIGYAYELSLDPTSYLSRGSHEVVVIIELPNSFNKKNPLYYNGRNRNSWD